jgi:hypothetical protein
MHELRERAEARSREFEPPPRTELPRFDRFELVEVWRNGDAWVDDCERGLAKGARIQGALELAIAEGLAALTVGNRLPDLGYHLDDYAREVLDVEPRTALKLVQMARELRTRPALRDALREGEVSLRAAQVVLPVAAGEDEAYWVGRAGVETVRALEAAVAAARKSPAEPEEEWERFVVGAKPEELEVIDDALEVAGQELGPDSKRFERMEAMAQEFLGGFAAHAGDVDARWTGSRAVAARADAALESRKAALESETNRWAQLPAIPAWQAPDLAWGELTTAAEIDATLRLLARYRSAWDDVVGYLAHQLQRSRVHLILGFATFRHYVEERLGLPPRAVEQRAALEQRVWESPALREARRQKLSYEKLRALSDLSDPEITSWIPRARGLTVIALRRELEAAEERQTRARGRVGALVPKRVACLLVAAIETIRGLAGAPIPSGRCLAIIAQHFLTSGGRRRGRRAARRRSDSATSGGARCRGAATPRPTRITWSSVPKAATRRRRTTRRASAPSLTYPRDPRVKAQQDRSVPSEDAPKVEARIVL